MALLFACHLLYSNLQNFPIHCIKYRETLQNAKLDAEDSQLCAICLVVCHGLMVLGSSYSLAIISWIDLLSCMVKIEKCLQY